MIQTDLLKKDQLALLNEELDSNQEETVRLVLSSLTQSQGQQLLNLLFELALQIRSWSDDAQYGEHS